jgi:branched-chain amino acid transport system ATP-binding protein
VASITQLRPASAARALARAAMPSPSSASALASNDALVLENVTRAFGALRAVDDVSLSVAAGQKYAVLGSNGAGKTTLFNAITGDFPPGLQGGPTAASGRIRFFGEDITELPPHERIRKGLRRTYQSSLLFRELTVRDNLFLAVRGVANGRYSFRRPGPAHASQRATDELLERARLTHIAGETVANLAHGQQRQLEIGMALAGAPRLILFDEPAAGLSPAERRELVALLRSLPGHMSFVLIEHDLDIALRVTEKVTVMHNGQVLKTGTPEQIEGDAQVQAIYMGGKH